MPRTGYVTSPGKEGLTSQVPFLPSHAVPL